MPAPYFHLLGHIFLAVDACEHNSSLADALGKAGFGKERIAKGRDLVDDALELVERKTEEVGEQRIYNHAVHGAADEVEMWKSSAEFRLKKALDDPAVLAKALGKDLHAKDHTVTVIAQALRLIAMVRAEPKINEALGTGRSVEDLIIRGWVLLNKLFKNGDILIAPGASGDPSAEVFADLEDHRQKMIRWVDRLGRASEDLRDQPSLLGELGYVPEGVGMPLGGTAYGVPLHQRAQREDLPDMTDLRPDPGWSAGRQGRNSENLGKGWVKPSFE